MTSLDTTTLVLLEEHVRRLLATMDFPAVTVRCHVLEAAPQSMTEGTDDGLFKNAALEATTGFKPNRSPREAQLTIAIEAGDEGRQLIGMQGAHLEALQHIIRALLRRQLATEAHISVDVNGYRARREEGLVQLANRAADEAKRRGQTVELKPMAASDRRAVHTALAERQDVKTESRGEGPRRHVVVQPIY